MLSKRWGTAQEYEKSYWARIAENIAANAQEQLTWYDWKAAQFQKNLSNVSLDLDRNNCRILEVGSGPIGIATYLKWGERYALDPLNDFYKSNPSLVALRDSNVNYITGKGEELPFPDGHFSIVIIDNVLDHVSTPDLVLDEIHRVLADNGCLYIELNIHTPWGCALHSILAGLNIDKGHPHSFTAEKIRDFIGAHKFTIAWDFIHSYLEARKQDRESSSLKAKVKGYSGLSEFIYCAVCPKKPLARHEKSAS